MKNVLDMAVIIAIVINIGILILGFAITNKLLLALGACNIILLTLRETINLLTKS